MKNEGKRLYNIFEGYIHLYKAFKSVRFYSKALKKGVLNEEFGERVMLAVTEVNGCAMCSYAHSRMALESGMNGSEIEELLSGSMESVPTNQLPAILFAQHYAESRGYPSKETWLQIVKEYGKVGSEGLLGAIRMIMMGNTYGIPLGSFLARFKKSEKRSVDSRSNVFYEIIMLLSFIVFFPISLVHSILASILHIPLIIFKK